MTRRPTRERVLTEAMRLFGEQGYAGTSIAQIEAAAGLSPGSGSLYRHFRSKQELLTEAVHRQLATGDRLVTLMEPGVTGGPGRRERVATVCRAGLARLHQDRDLSRLLVRDLAAFPDLLDEVRQAEMARIQQALARWLAAEAGQDAAARDWEAVATVLVGALANYWQLGDVFGTHPSGVAERRFIDALVDLTESALGNAASG